MTRNIVPFGMEGGGSIETSIEGRADVKVYHGDPGDVIIEIALSGDDDGWMSAVLPQEEAKRVGHQILALAHDRRE